MSRRAILKALGISASAAAAVRLVPDGVAALAAQAGGERTFPVTTMNHLSYSVPPDYKKVRDWYIDLLGMNPRWDDGTKCELTFGDNGIYFVQSQAGRPPVIGHFAFGIANLMAHKSAMKAEMERRGLENIRPDGEHGWICNDPAGYMLNTWVPIKDTAMFPGAASPCEVADSAKCKDAYEGGLKNIASLPKPPAKGLKATAYSMIALRVPEAARAKEKEFYTNALGMKVVSDSAEETVLQFGQNHLNLRTGQGPDGKPVCDTFGLLVPGSTHAQVKDELVRRGLSPKEIAGAWGITDPAGFPIQISGRRAT